MTVSPKNKDQVPSGSWIPSRKISFYALVILTFLCFLPTLNNGLLDWDDSGYVLQNENIRILSWETVRWAFTTFYCNYWTPLTWLSFALDYSLTGLNPVGYHLTNNIIHSLNAGLFFLVAHRLMLWNAFSKYEATHTTGYLHKNSIYCALLAALLFAVHPLRVESVAWATERKDVLAMFFGLLAIIAYLRRASREMHTPAVTSAPHLFAFLKSPSYWLTIVFFILSLSSKGMFVVLPMMLLVLDWFPLGRLRRRTIVALFMEKVPLLILCGLIAVVTMEATAYTRDSYLAIQLSSRMAIAFSSLVTYLRLFLWPINISTVYLNPGNVSIDITAVISFITAAGITCCCLLVVRKRPFFLASWLLFLIPLLPVLSVSGIHAMAPRFTYLPGLSLSLVSAIGVFTLFEMCDASPARSIVLRCATAAVLVLLVSITVRDIGFWKNDITLWSRVIELQPGKFGTAYYQRSLFFNLAGEYERALADVNEAFAIAQQKNYPGMYEIYGQRATILKNMKNYEAALADLSRVIESTGGMFGGKYYKERGDIYLLLGDSERAVADFVTAAQYSGAK